MIVRETRIFAFISTFSSGVASSSLPLGLSYSFPHTRVIFTMVHRPCFDYGRTSYCGSKPSKGLLHVSSVGADKDFFSMTTLGVP